MCIAKSCLPRSRTSCRNIYVTTLNRSAEDSAAVTSTTEGDIEYPSTLTGRNSERESKEAETTSRTASPTCQCICCSDRNTVHQPTNVAELKVSHSYASKVTGHKKHSRVIQTSWYKSYPWITVCTSQRRIFCTSCRSANDQGLLTPSILI